MVWETTIEHNGIRSHVPLIYTEISENLTSINNIDKDTKCPVLPMPRTLCYNVTLMRCKGGLVED
eukprot:2157046-Amphidinium_carterae.1